METTNPKQAIVDKVKKSNSILVTVSHDPSVDELAAALGFTLMLNKLGKHATAVFSGAIPPAIAFLEPEKTLSDSVDSLRDFIIALDKEKADRLRYKVEDEMVRIFITPYKTTISEKDLEFSQGDYNIELVIALGVEKQADLDEAISAHGRILHDATVATINMSNIKSSIGTIDWNDEKASSLCEMLMSLSEALQSNLLDEQIATALLTGIVAATDRFSNQHTTPRVMTMSAQLMAAGANQQLIAEKLQAGGESLVIDNQPATPQAPAAAEVPAAEPTGAAPAAAAPASDGAMQIAHETDAEDVALQLAAQAEAEQHEAVPEVTNPAEPVASPESASSGTDWKQPVADAAQSDGGQPSTHAMIDGGFSPSIHEASDESIADLIDSTKKKKPAEDTAEPPTKGRTLQPITMSPISTGTPLTEEALSAPAALPAIPMTPSIADLEAQAAAVSAPVAAPVDSSAVRSDIDAIYATQASPAAVAPVPVSVPVPAPTPTSLPAGLPPLPDFSTLPPLPPALGQVPAVPHPGMTPSDAALPPLPAAPAPGQFQIPS